MTEVSIVGPGGGEVIDLGPAAQMRIGDRVHDAVAGTLVMVPTGAPHAFSNPGDEPAVVLSTVTPDTYVQYLRDVRAAGRATPEIMARYATETSTGTASGTTRR